ncbi:hypothetical protein BSR28_01015 [Boudabousia liubingyangii]|uniref:hypothetical protein n=1 Tax=Boudabousia liubingyangii TaxID=1921764 RepID=UPI000938BC59|nr:hypothetical protein [Boudabousia liubingyangii]OKL48317.1 hypothetical protein BSR28_01015 [Boudabousia liubingyangii]
MSQGNSEEQAIQPDAVGPQTPEGSQLRPAAKAQPWLKVLIGISLLVLVVSLAFGIRIKPANTAVHVVPPGQLVASYRGGAQEMNSVDVYQSVGQVCVDTYSKSQFDIPDLYCFQTDKVINKSDITVTWLRYFGPNFTVESQSDEALVVGVKIQSGGVVLLDKYFSFVEKIKDVGPIIFGPKK